MKHVFNIILKLNNHPWKKIWNDFFLEKDDVQISRVAVVKKAPSSWKKKKNPSSLFVQVRPTEGCGEIF